MTQAEAMCEGRWLSDHEHGKVSSARYYEQPIIIRLIDGDHERNEGGVLVPS